MVTLWVPSTEPLNRSWISRTENSEGAPPPEAEFTFVRVPLCVRLPTGLAAEGETAHERAATCWKEGGAFFRAPSNSRREKLYHHLLPREIRHDPGEYDMRDWPTERLSSL